MDDIQDKYFPGSLPSSGPIEFHASDMWQGREAFRTVAAPARRQALLDLWALPGSLGMRTRPARSDLRQELMFFAVAIDRTRWRVRSRAPGDLYEWALEELCQRVNVHLSSMHKVGNPHKAIFVFDARQPSLDELVRRAFRSFQWTGTKYMDFLANAVATAFFIDSTDDRVLQLCDAFTYGVFRFFEHADDIAYRIIEPYFQRDASGKMHGVRHFPRVRGFP